MNVSCICQPPLKLCKAFDFKTLDIFPVAFKMLATKVICFFSLVGISQTSALKLSLSCKTIMNSFYQTEDQYYDLGCDRTNNNSEKVLLYRCRFLQKKMDIMGKQYYDFQVGLTSFLKGFLVLTIKLPVSFQDWSPWSECKNEQIKRSRKSCTGRTQTQTHNCNTEGIDQSK